MMDNAQDVDGSWSSNAQKPSLDLTLCLSIVLCMYTDLESDVETSRALLVSVKLTPRHHYCSVWPPALPYSIRFKGSQSA